MVVKGGESRGIPLWGRGSAVLVGCWCSREGVVPLCSSWVTKGRGQGAYPHVLLSAHGCGTGCHLVGWVGGAAAGGLGEAPANDDRFLALQTDRHNVITVLPLLK